MIAVRNLVKTIRNGAHQVEIIRDISFDVPSRQFVAVMGAVGVRDHGLENWVPKVVRITRNAAIGFAARKGKSRGSRGERLEPKPFEINRGTDVPRIRKHEAS